MPFRILFVCSGNTCRSPLAEALAERIFREERWDDAQVASAGTFATDGGHASAGSHEVARANGLDLESFESHRLTREMVDVADLVLVMEPGHRSAVLGLSPQADTKTFLLGEVAGASGSDAIVPDPFGGNFDSYLRTYRRIEQMIRGGLDQLRAMARRKKAESS